MELEMGGSRTLDSLCPVGISKQMPEDKEHGCLTISMAARPVYAHGSKGCNNIYRYDQQQHNDCSCGPECPVCLRDSRHAQMTRRDFSRLHPLSIGRKQMNSQDPVTADFLIGFGYLHSGSVLCRKSVVMDSEDR